MNIPHLQNDSKHVDIRRLKVNAQITALITSIEFLGNLTLFLHLYFVESNPWTSTIHGMVFYNIMGPYAFLSNTTDNKNRIIDTGWGSIFRNLLGIKQESILDSTDDSKEKSGTEQVNTDCSSSNSNDNRADTLKASNSLENKSIVERPATMENENIAKHNRVTSQKRRDSLSSKNNKSSFPTNLLGNDATVSIVSSLFRSYLTKSSPRCDDMDSDAIRTVRSETLIIPAKENEVTNEIDVPSGEITFTPVLQFSTSNNSISCTNSNTTATASSDKQLQSINSGIESKETIGDSLHTRKILLLQMIKDIQNEAKYLNSFTLLVSYEDHRKEGIMLSISELNNMFISQPLKAKNLQNVKQNEKEHQSTRTGHNFWGTRKQKRNCDTSNHNLEKLKLRGKSKQREKMRKELLGRYNVSNYDDQSIECLIQDLIKLEKSLIAE